MQRMEVAAHYTVMTIRRDSVDDSPTDSLRARYHSTRGRIINVKEIDKVERRTCSITITESEYMPSDTGSDKQGRDVHLYNISNMHNYSVGPSEDARQKRNSCNAFELPAEQQWHEDKTAEWVLYHSFSNNKPELIKKPVNKQYTHTGGRYGRYTCNICAMDSNMFERSFFSAVEIKDHLKMIHNMQGHHVCKICKKVYLRASDHYNHVQDKHYIKPEPLDDVLTETSLLTDPTIAMPSTSSHVETQVKTEASEEPPVKRLKMNR